MLGVWGAQSAPQQGCGDWSPQRRKVTHKRNQSATKLDERIPNRGVGTGPHIRENNTYCKLIIIKNKERRGETSPNKKHAHYPPQKPHKITRLWRKTNRHHRRRRTHHRHPSGKGSGRLSGSNRKAQRKRHSPGRRNTGNNRGSHQSAANRALLRAAPPPGITRNPRSHQRIQSQQLSPAPDNGGHLKHT